METTNQLTAENIGQLLREARINMGYRIEEVAGKLKINPKYLSALEENDYYQLPSPTYAKGFLISYANFLGLGSDELVKVFQKENLFFEAKQRVVNQQKEKQKSLPMFSPFQKRNNPKFKPGSTELHLLHRQKIDNNNLQKTAGIVLAIGIVVYLAFVITQPFLPPRVKLISPINNLEISQSDIVVKGFTQKGVIVKINNQPVTSIENGAFQENLTLMPGENDIKISAKKKNSVETIIWRQIFVK